MHRVLAALVLCSSAVLLAAAAPRPGPSAAPSPSPNGTASATPTPAPLGASVLVYPFDVQTGVDAKIGIAIAQIIAQEMTAAGGLTVLPVPEGVKRAGFLDYARQHNADFYISGYVTPVGYSAAVVEQVVSVESGVILFSQTAQVQSVADVASQSLQSRAQILAFVNRGTQSIAAQAANTPAPTATNGANVKLRGLSGIVDSVFHHRAGATPTPAPTAKPDRGVIVAPVQGTAPASDAKNATNELFFALQRHYRVELTNTANVAASADTICGTNRDNTIAAGTLADAPAAHGKHDTLFTLTVYTCFGAVLDKTTGKGGNAKSAIEAAVNAYATAHPQNG